MGDPAHKEPSMEDILSSIRKIVAQDEKKPPEPPFAPRGIQPDPDDEPRQPGSLGAVAAQIRERMQAFPVPDLSAESDESDEAEAFLPKEPAEADEEETRDDPQPDAMAPDPEPGPRPMEPSHSAAARRDAEAEAFRQALVAPETEKAVVSAFDRLKQNTLEQIEAKVDAIVRKEISDWLDAHLPGMVERMVREEVDRIARIEDIGGPGR